VDIADKIAYLNHDIDDGIRARILSTDEMNSLPIWQQARETVKADLTFPLFVSAMISRLITLMVTDLLENTDRLLKKAQDPIAGPSE